MATYIIEHVNSDTYRSTVTAERATIVRDIYTGELEHVRGVLIGECDISKHIASDVLDLAQREDFGRVSRQVLNFLHDHLGCNIPVWEG